MIEQESEGEKYFPTIAGVIHKGIKITETLELLDRIDLKNKRVMIELASYPIAEKYRGANEEFCEFFEAIAEKITAEGGTVLAGDSEQLIDLAAEELQQLWIESPSGYLCKYSEIVSKDRDPHFLDFARVNKPDIIILDREHAKFVAEKLGVSVVLVSP
ncbi:MAG: hypothetical protein UW68_C0007G0016 [Candidatus Collierbacteria bacterium GW2011_GWB1_44_6]|uniref:Uncharacterized protein n=2 Tax=Candidatus Collieribacteriota TaxID=1752725 RepID=A0A0G1JPR1_9BACT|nr:MAG: hypothetical protein UV68_C0013G0016 [Candidatus Collierbacteria bacterium GW2011_GWC2_43_12]KKT73531.1 MAG: hypothetical protein UW68_C0007G0016 [Candidatus Collierbacteria bacterium GW2011_GWB1_44_6]